MPQNKVKSPVFVYNDSNLSLKRQYLVTVWENKYIFTFPIKLGDVSNS